MLEKEKPSPKASKLVHTNRYEPLSEEYQDKLNSPDGKMHGPHSKEPKKANKKPFSLKEVVRQVQQDQAKLINGRETSSPKKDINMHKDDDKDTSQNFKQMTQETSSPDNNEEQKTVGTTEDNNTNKITETSPHETSRHQESKSNINSERQERTITNPCAKGNDHQAMARRHVASQRREEIHQEILEENRRETVAAKKAYQEARGAPDPACEEKDNRK